MNVIRNLMYIAVLLAIVVAALLYLAHPTRIDLLVASSFLCAIITIIIQGVRAGRQQEDTLSVIRELEKQSIAAQTAAEAAVISIRITEQILKENQIKELKDQLSACHRALWQAEEGSRYFVQFLAPQRPEIQINYIKNLSFIDTDLSKLISKMTAAIESGKVENVYEFKESFDNIAVKIKEHMSFLDIKIKSVQSPELFPITPNKQMFKPGGAGGGAGTPNILL